ncbi:hypothetical protein QYM36_006428 [Artemia franciscana]|uniref:Reverse transcriptase domain-containing protein n=1 Tax=Artemia franciscana TaxID=6661 RepID=A0AA88HWM7_ARTSF|nr:hypothetical protein QYM36_006428 [Artemia franciscana]
MPTFDEAILRHAGAKFFTKLDARHGYWSLVLDEESSQLTTFNTLYSRYKFKRMPFGLISAQDKFQRRMEEAFEGIQGFSVIVDDIIISGKTIEEHDANVRSALIRAREKGVKLNLQKCVFKCNSIPYFGHVISENGIHPDPQKVRALREMRTPNTKDELKTILGTMNYLARYIPNLSSINQPLRDLVKQRQFKWKQQHDTSFTNIKESICSSLAFFDPTAGNVELQVDASKFGLGATLSQNGKPISFASRSLNSTEQNYSQIEKELYAILFGCIHFHQYLYGRKFMVVSDHKPLQVVLNRPISKSSPRLQRMLLRIQPYNLIIAFRPGKEIPNQTKRKPCNVSIISTYAPTRDATETTKDDFYGELQQLSSSIARDYLIVAGDFNARVGPSDQTTRQILGKFGQGHRCENGQRLVNYALMNHLVITNTIFQHKPSHLLTWHSNDGVTKAQIDFILVRQRWRSSVQDSRSYNGADTGSQSGSDHRLVAAKILLRLAIRRKNKSKVGFDIASIPYASFDLSNIHKISYSDVILRNLHNPEND